MDQLSRIAAMERALDESSEAVAALLLALERYEAVQPALRELTAYYESPAWMQDHDDDAAGRIPQEMKRGVLSEDAVYDLLTDQARMMAHMRTLIDSPT